MQRRAHGRKRLNYLEQRATETEVAHSSAAITGATPSSTDNLGVKLPPTSITALAVVISVVGAAIILGTALWCYKRRKSQTLPSLVGKVTVERAYYSEKHIDLADVSIYTEKPEKAVVSSRSDIEAKWVPQVKAYPAVNIAVPAPTAAPKSKLKPAKSSLRVKTPSGDLARPPPSYSAATGSPDQENQSPRLIPIPPSPAVSTHSAPPPTPPANRRAKTSFASSMSEQTPMPSPSPRSESFAPHDLPFPKDTVRSPTDDHPVNERLPRLMTVAATFEPSLEDELAIKTGDTVRMLDEYRDGWCLVQRVGRIDAPKGAVPRFCLQERRGVVPILPTRKFSNGSLKSQASSWR